MSDRAYAAGKSKLVVHKLDADNPNNFTDVTGDFGDLSNLSAAELASKLADYSQKRGVDPKLLVAENTGG